MILLRRLCTQNVASLPDRTWEFQPGLQLIRGPNESGKSSLRKALTLVLFGDAATSKQIALKRWNADPPYLELEFEAEAKPYLLTRDFREGKNSLRFPDGRQTHSKETIRETLEKLLRIPTERAFEATVCMSQEDLHVDHPEDVHALIEKQVLRSSGTDVNKLLADLEKAQKELYKGTKHLAKEPGPLRRLQDDIGELNRRWAEARDRLQEAENAAEHLALAEANLAEAREELEVAKTRMTKHRSLLQATERRDALASQLESFEQALQSAQALDEAVARLRGEADKLEPRCAQLALEVAKATECLRLRRDLEDLGLQASAYDTECAAIAHHKSALATLRAQMTQLPVRRDEAENALRNLPTEITGLQEAIDAEREGAEGRGREIHAIEEESSHTESELGTLRVQMVVLKDLLELTVLSDERRQVEERVGAIREIKEAITRLEGAAQVGDVRPDEVTALHTIVAELSNALAQERISIGIEPLADIPFEVQIDDGGVNRETRSGSWEFHRRAELHIPGSARVVVENRSNTAAALSAREAKFRAALESCGCADWEQYCENEKRRLSVVVDLEARRSDLQRQLQGRPEAQWSASKHALDLREQEIRVRLGEAAERTESAEETRKRLTDVVKHERDLANRLAEQNGRLKALRTVPSGGVNEKLQQEVARKSAILLGILERAGVRQPAELRELLATHARLEQAASELEGRLATELAGRREEDVQVSQKAAHRRIAELAEKVAGCSGIEWTPAETEVHRRESENLNQERARLKEELRDALAGRKAIDSEELERQAGTARRALVTQDAIVQENSRFRLTTTNEIRLERSIAETERKVQFLNQDLGTYRERVSHEEGLRDVMMELEESKGEREKRLERLRTQDKVNADVSQVLVAARDAAVASLRQALPARVGTMLKRLTAGRYDEVQGDGLAAGVFSQQKKGILNREELSSGTADQLYLALRLAAIDALFCSEPPPLLLDDVLVHADTQRRAAMLDLLREFASRGQVLLFTCQEYPEYAALPALTLT